MVAFQRSSTFTLKMCEPPASELVGGFRARLPPARPKRLLYLEHKRAITRLQLSAEWNGVSGPWKEERDGDSISAPPQDGNFTSLQKSDVTGETKTE